MERKTSDEKVVSVKELYWELRKRALLCMERADERREHLTNKGLIEGSEIHFKDMEQWDFCDYRRMVEYEKESHTIHEIMAKISKALDWNN